MRQSGYVLGATLALLFVGCASESEPRPTPPDELEEGGRGGSLATPGGRTGGGGRGGEAGGGGAGGGGGTPTTGGKGDGGALPAIDAGQPSGPDARPDTASPIPVDATGGDSRPAPPADENAYLGRPVPVLWVTVGGKAIAKGAKTPGTLKVIEEPGKGELTGIEGLPVALESKIGMELRGQSSSYYFAQRPYGIELVDDAGKDRELPLLGLPKESDFVLHSCYADKTCMRNALTYATAREMVAASGRWAPRTRWIELYLDGKYMGLFLLVEKPKGDKSRMNLTRPAATKELGDLSGAYVFSADGDANTFAFNPRDDQREWYDMRTNRRWKHRFPNRADVTPAQKAYISGAFDALQVALLAKSGWREQIDPQSWMDYYLVTELTNNVDAFFRSWFFTKQPDSAGGKFFMGPVWDYDIAYGNANYGSRYCATNTQLGSMPAPFATPVNDPAFQNEMRCRWNTLRKAGGPLDVGRLEAKIDSYVKHIREAKARDAMRWGNVGKYVWPNNYVGATWDDDVAYLRYWLRRRISWIDARGKGRCDAQPAPPPVTLTKAPAPAPNDMRAASAQAKPPQIDLASQPGTYIPIEGPADAKWACPPP